jgi:hypothetical protein
MVELPRVEPTRRSDLLRHALIAEVGYERGHTYTPGEPTRVEYATVQPSLIRIPKRVSAGDGSATVLVGREPMNIHPSSLAV